MYDTSLHLINKDLGMQKEKFSVMQQERQHYLSHLKVQNIFFLHQKLRNDVSVGHTTDAQCKLSSDSPQKKYLNSGKIHLLNQLVINLCLEGKLDIISLKYVKLVYFNHRKTILPKNDFDQHKCSSGGA